MQKVVFILQKFCDVHMTSGDPYGQGIRLGRKVCPGGRFRRGRLDVMGAVGIKGEEARFKSLFSSLYFQVRKVFSVQINNCIPSPHKKYSSVPCRDRSIHLLFSNASEAFLLHQLFFSYNSLQKFLTYPFLDSSNNYEN